MEKIDPAEGLHFTTTSSCLCAVPKLTVPSRCSRPSLLPSLFPFQAKPTLSSSTPSDFHWAAVSQTCRNGEEQVLTKLTHLKLAGGNWAPTDRRPSPCVVWVSSSCLSNQTYVVSSRYICQANCAHNISSLQGNGLPSSSAVLPSCCC